MGKEKKGNKTREGKRPEKKRGCRKQQNNAMKKRDMRLEKEGIKEKIKAGTQKRRNCGA